MTQSRVGEIVEEGERCSPSFSLHPGIDGRDSSPWLAGMGTRLPWFDKLTTNG